MKTHSDMEWKVGEKSLTRSIVRWCVFFSICQVELNANYCVLIILWVPLFSKPNDRLENFQVEIRQSNINLNAVACVMVRQKKKDEVEAEGEKKNSNWFVYWLIFFISRNVDLHNVWWVIRRCFIARRFCSRAAQ